MGIKEQNNHFGSCSLNLVKAQEGRSTTMIPGVEVKKMNCNKSDKQYFNAGVKGHVLVVDDEEQIRFSISLHLKKERYKVSVASDGTTALDNINHYAVTSNPIDLLICDIQMSGMNGEELIDTLNQQQVKIPIIVISGYWERESAFISGFPYNSQ